MKKNDDLNNVNEIEFEQRVNMPEEKAPAKPQETKGSKGLRGAMPWIVTIAVLALTICFIIVLVNKNPNRSADNAGNHEETVQETASASEEAEKQTIIDANSEEGEGQEPAEEEPEVVEPEAETPMVTEPQTANEWIISIEGTGHPVSIWNDNTKEGTVIEDEGQYYITEGDKLLIEHNMDTINIPPTIVIEESNTTYATCSISNLPEYLTVTINSEVAQKYGFYLTTKEIDPVLPIDLGNDTEDEITSEGERWVASLTYDEPKLVIYNDETGINTVLEDGDTYQMQAGDQMAAYMPEGYIFEWMCSNDKYYEFSLKSNYVLIIFEYSGLAENKLFFFNTDYTTQIYTYEILPAN